MKTIQFIKYLMIITFSIVIISSIAIAFLFTSRNPAHDVHSLATWEFEGDTITLPISLDLLEDQKKVVIEKEILEVDEDCDQMLISVKYNAVKAYLDDILIYESAPLEYGMKSAGVESDIINLKGLKTGSKVTLELTPYLDGYQSVNINTPLLGNEMTLLHYTFARDCFDILMETSLIVIGIFIMIAHIFMNKKESSRLNLLTLGLLSFVSGGYTLVQMQFIHLVVSNSYLLYYIEFSFLMILPIIVLLLTMHTMKETLHKTFNALQVMLIGNFMFQHFAHFILHIEFRELLYLTHICILFVIVFCVFAMIYTHKSMKEQNKEMIFSLLPVLIGGTADLAIPYLGMTTGYYSAYYFKIGLFIFIIIQIYYNYHRFLYNLNERLKAETYRKLAFSDALTKLNNRLAFETDLKGINEVTGKNTICFSIDINNLKEVNDTLGHKKGDELIIAVAEILKKAVSNQGKIYRIGGDEFIILLFSISTNKIDQLLEKMELEKKKEQQFHEFIISYAIGISEYQANDENAEKMIARADHKMYENKRVYKQKNMGLSMVGRG